MRIIISLILTIQVLSAQSALINDRDFLYLGSFKFPTGISQLNYSGSAIAYNSTNDSLFVVGNINTTGNQVAEFKIPSIGGTASLIQSFTEPTEGKWTQASVPGTPTKIGGLLVDGNKLYGTLYAYYDGGTGQQSVSHWRRPVNLSTKGQVEGIYRIYDKDNEILKSRFFGGWLGFTPTKDIFTGQCCITNSSSTSNGLAAWIFKTAEFAQNTPSTAKFYYTSLHPLGTGWNTTSSFWNGTTRIAGTLWRGNSILFFGKQGIGKFCYGIGGSTPPADSNIEYCYDPDNLARGTHAYPYINQVWAFNSDDVVAHPYDIRPYAIWQLIIPGTDGKGLISATFDLIQSRIYMIQQSRTGISVGHIFNLTTN